MGSTGYLLMDEHSGKGMCRFPASLDVILKKEVTEFHPDKYLARAQGFAPPDLLRSVQQGLRMTAELLFREGHCRQLMGVQIDLGLNEGECGAFNGRSADLAFALGVMAEIRGLDQPMAATGVLLDSGLVGRVSGVVEKLTAAADCLPPGSSLFYPGDNHREFEEEQRTSLQELQERGFTLVPVDSLEEVALQLGIPVQGVWRSEPYKGLGRFDVIDKGIFFGRDGDSKRAVDKLHSRAEESCPGLMVLSESGVGKSSFVRAGVLATLHSEPGQQYLSLVFDERLFDAVDEREFCRRIVEAMGSAIGEQAPESPPDTLEAVADWILELDLSRQPVLVFDQFEQLFTGNHTPDLVVRFAHLLLRLQRAGVWIIACMRCEFYPDYAGVKDEHGNALLLAVFGDSPAGLNGLFDLKPLSVELLRSVIQGPASIAGVSFGFSQEGANLVDRIVADVGQHTDVLPLLEFLLERLYQQRDPETGTIAYETYERIGGLSGALEQAAEEAVAGQPREVVEAVMRAMVQTSADHKELVLASSVDITHLDEASFEYQSIRALENARLLTVGASCRQLQKISARLVHEALIQRWPRAAALFSQSSTFSLIRDRDQLRKQALLWREENYSATLLPSDPVAVASSLQLRAKLSCLEVDALTKTYLNHLQLFANRHRRARWLKVVAVTTFALVLSLWGFEQFQAQKAKLEDTDEQKKELEKQLEIVGERVFQVQLQGDKRLKRKLMEQESTLVERFRHINDENGDLSPVDKYLEEIRFGIRDLPYEKYENGIIYEGHEFPIKNEVLWHHQHLVSLIFYAESINLDEKSFWISRIDRMADEKVDRLYEILRTEYNTVHDLSRRYTNDSSEALANKILDGEVAITGRNLARMLHYAEEGQSSGRLSGDEYMALLRGVERRASRSARSSINVLRQYKKLMSLLYSVTPKYEDKLSLSESHLDVFRDAEKIGIVSGYDVSEVNLRASWYALFSGHYQLAEKYSSEGKVRTPGFLLLDTNRAHALALQGKTEAAEKLYKSHYGIEMGHSLTGLTGRSWKRFILQDFEDLAAAGIKVQLFDDIRDFFKSKKSKS